MAWFKVDDKFHSSVEVMAIPLDKRAAAIGLWTIAGAWSADQLKDGFVPVTHLETWGGSKELASALVRAKLWIRVGSRGFQFRNWDKWQTTRADVEDRQEAWREKKAQQRAAKAVKPGSGPQPVPGDTSGSPQGVPSFPSRPVPTHPDPSLGTTTDITYDVLLSTEITARDDLTQAAESLGIKNLPRITAAYRASLNRDLDDDYVIDLTIAILELSTDHVRSVEAYIEKTCRNSPDTVQREWDRIYATSPLAVLK